MNDAHIQHPACPECGATRTIRTAINQLTHSLYCPECGHIWEHPIEPTKPWR